MTGITQMLLDRTEDSSNHIQAVSLSLTNKHSHGLPQLKEGKSASMDKCPEVADQRASLQIPVLDINKEAGTDSIPALLTGFDGEKLPPLNQPARGTDQILEFGSESDSPAVADLAYGNEKLERLTSFAPTPGRELAISWQPTGVEAPFTSIERRFPTPLQSTTSHLFRPNQLTAGLLPISLRNFDFQPVNGSLGGRGVRASPCGQDLDPKPRSEFLA
jgi:hypothetical protein